MPGSLLGRPPSLHALRRRSPALVRTLRRYYAVARLPATVHVGLIAHRLLPPVRSVSTTDSDGTSRFSRVEFLCVRRVFDSAGPRGTRVIAPRVIAFRTRERRPLPDLRICRGRDSRCRLPPAQTRARATSAQNVLEHILCVVLTRFAGIRLSRPFFATGGPRESACARERRASSTQPSCARSQEPVVSRRTRFSESSSLSREFPDAASASWSL